MQQEESDTKFEQLDAEIFAIRKVSNEKTEKIVWKKFLLQKNWNFQKNLQSELDNKSKEFKEIEDKWEADRRNFAEQIKLLEGQLATQKVDFIFLPFPKQKYKKLIFF